MRIEKLDVPIAINKMIEHENIKEQLLTLINESPGERVHSQEHNDLDITKCDYKLNNVVQGMDNPDRKWLHVIKPHLLNVVKNTYKNLGYDTYRIHNIWFQQYAQGSTHGWHCHTDCQWTNVYYLDMPNGSPKTELVMPASKNQILRLDVEEGDVVTFPSFIIHRAPVNNGQNVKTIISWNSDSDIESGKEITYV
tara:strand:+ start:1449 stop:2033 length:585 start_codon:yes stop_codon:yes gene_type:complete